MKLMARKQIIRNILVTSCIISACCGLTSIRFGCSLYTFHDPQYSTWEESRLLCNSSGGDLVAIEEFQEWQFLNNTVQSLRTVKYYIGLTKDNRTRQWSWLSNGKSVNASTGRFPWATGEPREGGAYCATMYKDYGNNYGLFDDLRCSQPHSDAGYICEMAVACMNEVPTSFNVTPLTATSVGASWEFTSSDSLPLGVVIRGFKLLYRLRNSSDQFGTAIVWDNSTFRKNISGLEKYAEYEFKVLAFTANGNGPSSSVLVVRTDEDVPSLAPAKFTVASQTSTSILAFWQPPPTDSRNGIIIGFKLFYKRKGSSNSGYTVYIHDALTYNATRLLKYTEYELQVLAFTKIGDGPNTSVLTTRTRQDVPSQAPVNLIVTSQTSTSIVVSWQPPPLDSRNGIIIGFKLFYKRKGSTDLGHTVNIRNALTHNATWLLKYTEYEFQVLAFTQIGNGPNSSVLATRTKQDVPSQAPVNFTVASQTSTSILASWQLPPTDSRNGIIIGFKLLHKRKGSVESENTVVVQGGTTLRKSITGLLKYTEYEVQVLAFTAVGDGPKTLTKTVRTEREFSVPTIEEDVSPPFVICEMGTLCLLFCYATSEYPRTMMYSWTKNGISLTDGDGFKIISNSVVVRPHRMEDYGVYACKASNGIHATTYNITLGVKLNSSAVVFRREENESHDSRFVVTATVLSTVIMLLLIPIGLFLWQRRKMSRQDTNVSENWHTHSQSRALVSLGETEQAYMELQPQGGSLKHVYQTLQGKVENIEYCNVQLNKDNVEQDTGDYEIAATC